MVFAAIKWILITTVAVRAVALVKCNVRGIQREREVAKSAPGRYQESHVLFLRSRRDLIIVELRGSDAGENW